jgi:hypothetical protein
MAKVDEPYPPLPPDQPNCPVLPNFFYPIAQGLVGLQIGVSKDVYFPGSETDYQVGAERRVLTANERRAKGMGGWLLRRVTAGDSRCDDGLVLRGAEVHVVQPMVVRNDERD